MSTEAQHRDQETLMRAIVDVANRNGHMPSIWRMDAYGFAECTCHLCGAPFWVDEVAQGTMHNRPCRASKEHA